MADLVTIDTYECNGCGSCAELCPEVFAMDEDGAKAHVHSQPEAVTAELEKAAAFCPQACITLSRA